LLEYQKEYRQKNKKELNENAKIYRKKKNQTDPCFKLRSRLRQRLYSALKGRNRGGSAVRDLGCSVEDLKTHIESMWLPGMTWENWSLRGWHIDHIIPLYKFDLTDPDQVKISCNFKNLQPL
jgi:hypothetical protein